MRVPRNRPRDLVSCALAVLGVGGLIFVAQVVSLGGSPLPPTQLALLAVASAWMQRTVTIAANAVLVDGRHDFPAGGDTRVIRVHHLAAQQPPVLEIGVVYHGRMLHEQTVRLRVPPGREAEARALAERFATGRWHMTPHPAAPR